MHFIKIPKLNLIVGINPKVACTTIFHLLLTKLGHPIQGNIHLDMLTKVNLKSGKYGIYELDPELDHENIENYTKICVIRNPYTRLISGIRQRSWFFIHDFKKLDVSKNTITEFLEKGGEIKKCDTGAVTEGAVLSVWKKGPGRPKKEA